MPDLIRYEVRDRVAVLTVDNPPVNALGPGVLEGIEAAVARGNADAGVDAMVLIGAGSTFIAGADIKIFGTIENARTVAGALRSHARAADAHRRRAPSRSSRPSTATALGGGLEVAMSCHYRVMAADAKVGQPEVLLGIIPGAGGTQRLPRLCGAEMAIEMCTAGKPVPAAKALAAGIVDQIAGANLLDDAIAFAQVAGRRGPQDARALGEDRRSRRRSRGLRRRANHAREDGAGRQGAVQGRRCHRGRLHARLRRGLGARARAVRRLRHLPRVARAGAHVLRRSRSREGARTCRKTRR